MINLSPSDSLIEVNGKLNISQTMGSMTTHKTPERIPFQIGINKQSHL
jgi:hypothetical protein